MSVHLICPNGHRFTRPTVSFRRDGARCPKCEAVTWQREKVKACPAAPGCPQTPECTGCAYDAPKPPHPMMAMQEGQTAQGLTEAEEHLLDAEESPRLCDIYPVDPDLDDPDSPKHQGAI